MIAVIVGILIAIQQRERLVTLAHMIPKLEWQIPLEGRRPPANDSALQPPAAKPAPLRPTDYGVYAISNNALIELQQLPGRPLKFGSRYLPRSKYQAGRFFRTDIQNSSSSAEMLHRTFQTAPRFE